MTVKELIERLRSFDSEAKVYLLEERDEFEATQVYSYSPTLEDNNIIIID